MASVAALCGVVVGDVGVKMCKHSNRRTLPAAKPRACSSCSRRRRRRRRGPPGRIYSHNCPAKGDNQEAGGRRSLRHPLESVSVRRQLPLGNLLCRPCCRLSHNTTPTPLPHAHAGSAVVVLASDNPLARGRGGLCSNRSTSPPDSPPSPSKASSQPIAAAAP